MSDTTRAIIEAVAALHREGVEIRSIDVGPGAWLSIVSDLGRREPHAVNGHTNEATIYGPGGPFRVRGPRPFVP